MKKVLTISARRFDKLLMLLAVVSKFDAIKLRRGCR